ncbi:MAG: MMPL family transporter [Panacagrimonas sp.]
MPGVRFRFWLWTAAMAALVLFYVLRVVPQLRIETDLFALLPEQEQEPAAALAQQRYSNVLSHKLLFMVGASDAEKAREAAAKLAGRLRSAQVFEQVMLEVDAAQTISAPSDIYRKHRFGFLAEPQRQLLLTGQTAPLLAQALTDIYGPGLLPRALPVAQDPFNFLGAALAQQAGALGNLRPEHGVPMLTQDGTHYVLIAAQIGAEPFSTETQDRIVPVIDAATAQARSEGAVVLSSGVILHAADAARRARAEITLVGSLSMVGVALMILLTFRSLRPLALSALVLGSGALAALSLCQLVFGKVTLIALVFGSGLIGVAVDYSTHFLADQFRKPSGWTPHEALRHVGPGIAMGMGCAVLGYLSLGLTPLPGLRQMAVFSAAGLIVACCSVLCWYPVLAPRPRRGEPLPLRWAMRLDRSVDRFGSRGQRLAAVVVAALALFGLSRIEFVDDVGLLYSAAPERLADDARVSELLGSTPDSQFFLVQGRSPEEVLEREEQLREWLDPQVSSGGLATYRAVTRALPSPQRQQHNHALLSAQVYRAGGLGPQLMEQLGFPPDLIAQRLAEFAAAPAPLRVDEWLSDTASAPYRDLWLGSVDNGYAGIVSLSGIRDFAALRSLPAQLPGVQFVDRAAAVSELLGRYRRLALLLLAAAYGLVGAAMALRYGSADAARLLAAPLSAALLTLAVLGACGGMLNLFHVLGLFVVLGLGVDYAVFLREGVASRAATVLAIGLSSVGAALSYGLLAFSATPFIRAIGLTLLVGVGFTFVLALVLQRPGQRTEPA